MFCSFLALWGKIQAQYAPLDTIINLLRSFAIPVKAPVLPATTPQAHAHHASLAIAIRVDHAFQLVPLPALSDNTMLPMASANGATMNALSAVIPAVVLSATVDSFFKMENA